MTEQDRQADRLDERAATVSLAEGQRLAARADRIRGVQRQKGAANATPLILPIFRN
jgi:hypothetical protein